MAADHSGCGGPWGFFGKRPELFTFFGSLPKRLQLGNEERDKEKGE